MVKITIMIDSNEVTVNQSAAPTKVEQKNKKFFIVMGNQGKKSWIEFISDDHNTAINKLNNLITHKENPTYTYTLITQDENGVLWNAGSDWDIDSNNIQKLITTMEYKEINSLMEKCIKERNNPCEKNEAFSKALINAENALRELKRFY